MHSTLGKIVTRGDGVWVYDQAGSRLFDTLSGMWLSNTGHGRREVADAVHAQICELPKDQAGSDTEASGFALSSGLQVGSLQSDGGGM